MNRMHIAVAMVAAIAPLSVASVFACSCVGSPSPKTALRRADAVFTGHVLSERLITPHHVDAEQRERELTFEVMSVWKGATRKRITIRTPIDNTMCGYDFRRGPDYIVYASAESRVLRTNDCTRTDLVINAQADLHVLGHGTTPK